MSGQEPLVRIQASGKRVELGVLLQGLGVDLDGLGFALTPQDLGLPFRLGEQNGLAFLCLGLDLDLLLSAFGPELGGRPVSLGVHTGEDARGHLGREIGPFDPHVQEFDT